MLHRWYKCILRSFPDRQSHHSVTRSAHRSREIGAILPDHPHLQNGVLEGLLSGLLFGSQDLALSLALNILMLVAVLLVAVVMMRKLR
jgi:hypothetical protein